MLRLIIGAVVIYFVFWFLNRLMHPKRRPMQRTPHGSRHDGRSAIDADFEELNDR